MTDAAVQTRSVVVERELPHPPDKVWRALTQRHLLEEWLMASDFEPVVGKGFSFRADWGSVEGQVLAVEPNRSLSYSWEAMGLQSVVTWTLAPAGQGTRLRMEQVGFRPDQEQAYRGATAGWPRFLDALGRVLDRLD